MLEGAVVGKQPTLSPRSTAKREPLAPAKVGDGTIISTGAVLFAGSTIGARVILGDQSCVRERVTIGDDVVVGRGSLVENDTTIGAMTKIQAGAYITAYSTLEEHVFIAPCVVTSNDNFMGRTEKRHELIEGPTIRRGARIGAGSRALPRGRDRRGGVRRRRRRRHEGRRAANARRRQPRAAASRRARRGVARLLALHGEGELVAARRRRRAAHFDLDVVRPDRRSRGRRAAPGRSWQSPSRGAIREHRSGRAGDVRRARAPEEERRSCGSARAESREERLTLPA